MTCNLPAKLNPSSLAEQESTVNGSVSVSHLPRLRKITTRDDTEIFVRMKFYLHSSGFPVVDGQIEGQIEVRCERCLNTLNYSLDERFELLLQKEGQSVAESLTESFEIVEYAGDIDTAGLLEDQVILTLPLVMRHEHLQDCDPEIKKWMQEKAEFEKQMEKPNPFAVLKKLDP